jgi:hypothetical protein
MFGEQWQIDFDALRGQLSDDPLLEAVSGLNRKPLPRGRLYCRLLPCL